MESRANNPIIESAKSPEDRVQLILEMLDRSPSCSYEELAQRMDVSTMTIRRDLEPLIKKGAVIKTVGGVQRADAPSYLYETAVYSRLATQRAEKRAIAKAALDLITVESTIFIDGSTTCLELARRIAKEKKGLTVLTHSALACLELGKSTENTIIGIGGQYDNNSLCFVGPQAEDVAKNLFVDMAFVGTKAFLPAEGTFESSLPTFRIKQIVAERCARMVLLADHSKIGQRALSKVLDISQIHTLVTDDQIRQSDLAALPPAGPKVVVAPRLNHRVEKDKHGD
ncbi:MAG TPA: DeoR/GlpR family DNA-binding transcription regulator [Lacunisphaera sp.]|jgi:DeoR/GlpR family transcriptional regulator of sugar metabolism|nr:DeoR/GlpR family DNA-binding transcription regulator [Lacunisphaera sp.]